MALTEAEKQQRYRERHVGANGDKVRVDWYLGRECVATLRHLARHRKCSVTQLVEDLARDTKHTLKYERMTAAQRRAYEESTSDLDYLDRGWIRRIRAQEAAAPKRKTLLLDE